VEEHRNGMERTKDGAGAAEDVGLAGQAKRIRIEFNDGVNTWTTLVQPFDPSNVLPGQIFRCEPAGRHLRLELSHGRLVMLCRNVGIIVTGRSSVLRLRCS